jgi:DNA-binding MarR family transcriptional regulator
MKKRPPDARPAGRPAPEGAASPAGEAASRPLGALLHRLSLRLHAELGRALEPLRLTVQHFFVLFNVSRAGPCSQLALGECAAINRTTMVSLVDDLEGLGLVRRQRDPGDRRAYLIHLTAKGAATLGRAMTLRRGAEARCLAPLSEAQQQLLRDLLARLIAPPPERDAPPGGAKG